MSNLQNTLNDLKSARKKTSGTEHTPYWKGCILYAEVLLVTILALKYLHKPRIRVSPFQVHAKKLCKICQKLA